MKPRRLLIPAALLLTAALLTLLVTQTAPPQTPGLAERERTLLRIWVLSAPGGAQAWLTQQLRAFEKAHPGVMTHLRIVSPQELTRADAVLPDVLLYMPGDVADPSALSPLAVPEGLRETLLSCGRWQGTQYGLPLCWGAWVLAIDSALDPLPAATPAPTTLLGRPAVSDAPTDSPGYPLTEASKAECALQAPGGAALLALAELLPAHARPPLPVDFAQLSSAEVFAAFQSRRCTTAMLTTGQITAFSGLVSAGRGFPFRLMLPDTVVTDQVWLASLTPEAPACAADLLAFLASPGAQQALTAQGLHTVRDDLTLYAAGFSADVEAAGHRSITAVNAYLPADRVHSAAWQAFQGTISTGEALNALR